MIFLTSTFFHLFLNLSPRFPDFCHVRKIFTTFLPTTNNAILLTTRVLVLHMFRFPSSSDSATPTTNFEFPQSNYFPPSCQLSPQFLSNHKFSNCNNCHCHMLFNRQTNEAVMISTTTIDHSFFNHQAQQRNSFHSSCCHDFYNYD